MRIGDWIQTFSGRQFWPLDPRTDEVFVEDIAHALAMQCRYAGHCLRFYSVAEHSVLLARKAMRLGGAADARWALLHDASEAYLLDLPRPLKRSVTGYREAEARVMENVCDRFGLPADMPQLVHDLDSRIIGDERANLARSVAAWDFDPEPIGVVLKFWTPADAENAFLAEFERLFPEHAR